MAAKASRVQLSDADRKLICDLAQSNSNLTQEKLTRLVAERLGKPDLARSTVTGVLKHSDKWLKVSQTSASKTVKHRGPSLTLMRQQLKGFATFMADNPQFSAADELVLQRFSDKVAKMLVSRMNHRRQQSITSFFSAANALV